MKNGIMNVLSLLLGLLIGGATNMAIIMISDTIIALPEGVDNTSMESLVESMHLFEPKHYIFPFIAHALGTFVGAVIASMIARTYKLTFAMAVASFFLAGGIINAFLLPAPSWFILLDVLVAYLPMGYIAWKLVASNANKVIS